jgi:eukaryotic-like serine/threonine-protein kinase
VAYFLLVSQPLFVRATAIQTVAAHMLDPVVGLNYLRSDIPADLEQIVLRCLAKEPSERFASTEHLERALQDSCLADQWTEEHARAWWQSQAG